MSHTVISVENVSKYYRLGLIGGGTLRADFDRWWAKVRGKSDPLLKIGQEDHGNRQGGYIWALRDLSFDVKQGTVLGIIGRNGAGKSTLLKILSRVTAPTSGKIKVKGRVASLLEVGTGFHPELTGRENIYLNGAILGMKQVEIKRKFDEIVAFSEIEKFIDTPVKRYSSGMYVRLAFAVAAHLEPEILIVDEVLAVGDYAFQRKCLGKMHDVAGQGRTVLFVSHNMQAIKRLCEKGILLSNGSISEYSNVDTLVEKYLNTMTQQILNTEILPENHKVYPPALEVFCVELLNSQNKSTDTLIINEEFSIIISFKVHKSDQRYRIGIGFFCNDGTHLATITSSDEEGTHIFGINNMKYKLAVKCKNVFLPGKYTINIGIKNFHGAIIDIIDGISFFVDTLIAGKSFKYGAGVVHLKADWKSPINI
jgi:lipopolysaccharide transport system ATP-binding protein